MTPVNILVFNCGSSSLKYKLIRMPEGRELAGGEAQRVGPRTARPSRIVHRSEGAVAERRVEMPNHTVAFEQVTSLLSIRRGHSPDAFAHRLVHGGSEFTGHTILDQRAFERLGAIRDLAPMHNPPAVDLIEACRRLRPDLPQALVFDTVFHETIPECARTYALPQRIRAELGLRKYGFHGISHAYVAAECARFLNIDPDRLNAVSCHLGSGGASLCAIVHGRSVDNTMGYSPLQGLVMSTRCGDLDPAVALSLVANSDGDPAAAEALLSRRSGLLGLSGASSDLRDVLDPACRSDADAERFDLTRGVYLWRLRKYLGAYLAVVGGAHAVIFTDTIGQSVPVVRWAACTGMEVFGLHMDSERNESVSDLPADVAADESKVRIVVIKTDEESAIARCTYEMLQPRCGAKGAGPNEHAGS